MVDHEKIARHRQPSEVVKMAAYSDILSSLDEFFEFCRRFGMHAEAEAGRFGVYRLRITQLSAEIDRLRAAEYKLPIYTKLNADLPRYLVALGESGEIREMLPFLRVCPEEELAYKLRVLLSGTGSWGNEPMRTKVLPVPGGEAVFVVWPALGDACRAHCWQSGRGTRKSRGMSRDRDFSTGTSIQRNAGRALGA